MKKMFLFVGLLVLTTVISAQNIQLHYDFGEGRKLFTSTVEMFKPDSYGATFFFIDMDYSASDRNVDNGISLAYWEIARAFKWREKQTLMPRVEYNGGTFKLDGVETGFIPIENSWLVGVENTWASSDYSKIVTLIANYKYIQGKENLSFQLTAVWTLKMLAGKLTFNGFADFWKEEMFWGTDFRFLSEPQLWYNFNDHFSLGGEVELSNNFIGDKFAVNPTVGVKYVF
ncbi:MAG: DUF5020 domain-containing protein [Bacteroidetes bacterium]|nr:MAG: DUF5020 domain-containing protein [Bacteroidota bacterium]PIE88481.1 MAG: DUF5020 domain-containing protein [Bacteroidota bacterium]